MTQSTHDFAFVHAAQILTYYVLTYTLRTRSRPVVPYNDDKIDDVGIPLPSLDFPS